MNKRGLSYQRSCDHLLLGLRAGYGLLQHCRGCCSRIGEYQGSVFFSILYFSFTFKTLFLMLRFGVRKFSLPVALIFNNAWVKNWKQTMFCPCCPCRNKSILPTPNTYLSFTYHCPLSHQKWERKLYLSSRTALGIGAYCDPLWQQWVNHLFLKCEKIRLISLFPKLPDFFSITEAKWKGSKESLSVGC